MGLVRTALVFGAGYALGHPAGRAKVAELARRPEVAQLRDKVAATASTGVEAGKKQLAKATDKTATTTSDNASSPTGDIESSTWPAHRAGRRLPSFPGRGARTPAATAPPASPTARGGAAATSDVEITAPTPPLP
jgi:hypothetical protein